LFIKAVILAAGEGKRLRPFTETMPKVMIPVANKPILEYVLDSVKNSGINEIIAVVGYKKEVIMEYFKDYSDLEIKYVLQDKQLGTAHALLQTEKYIDDTFIVLSGDNIIDQISISKLIKDKNNFSMLIKENPQPSKYGVVFFEKNLLQEIVEKPKEEVGRFISTGIYKLQNSIFDNIKEFASQGIFDISSVIQSIIEKGDNINTTAANLWMDIVYPWDLIQVNESIIRNNSGSLSGVIEKGVTLKGPVKVGNNTSIYSGSYIVGPVVIGEGCEIGPNACIFPATTIGNNSVIRPFSEIRNTVIMNDVHIGSNSFISHSVIAHGNIIGHNFSSMSGQATMEIDGEYKKLETIGTMIGENCTIEGSVIVEPGITIGRKCKIGSINKIIRNIPSQSKVM